MSFSCDFCKQSRAISIIWWWTKRMMGRESWAMWETTSYSSISLFSFIKFVSRSSICWVAWNVTKTKNVSAWLVTNSYFPRVEREYIFIEGNKKKGKLWLAFALRSSFRDANIACEIQARLVTSSNNTENRRKKKREKKYGNIPPSEDLATCGRVYFRMYISHILTGWFSLANRQKYYVSYFSSSLFIYLGETFLVERIHHLDLVVQNRRSTRATAIFHSFLISSSFFFFFHPNETKKTLQRTSSSETLDGAAVTFGPLPRDWTVYCPEYSKY